MDDNLTAALIMAFSVIVFIIALSITMYMFSEVTATSEILVANADTTKYYDNILIFALQPTSGDCVFAHANHKIKGLLR